MDGNTILENVINQHPDLSVHIQLEQKNDETDFFFKDTQKFIEVTDVLTVVPYGCESNLVELLAATYQDRIALSTRTRNIFHLFVPDMVAEETEYKSAGVFKKGNTLLGIGKLLVHINPVPSEFSIEELYSIPHYQELYAVKPETIEEFLLDEYNETTTFISGAYITQEVAKALEKGTLKEYLNSLED
ncbi:MAG: hypothetical protein KC535_02885 [Nanoarchaeota archaeon]|nr:hypothetical protein [Nanoarchaeota archaeon]